MQSNPKRTYVRITYKQRRIDFDYVKHGKFNGLELHAFIL